jgi:hypothetical protein
VAWILRSLDDDQFYHSNDIRSNTSTVSEAMVLVLVTIKRPMYTIEMTSGGMIRTHQAS